MDGSRAWWKEAVVYQIYPKSFNDADGDGVGDLRGIAEQVDYLDDLGVDVVWLNPIYDSPQVDYGYDIRDYRAIDPQYGTMADWAALRDRLHERDIRLVMDLAINHTSDEHEWFQRSRDGTEAHRDYYHWVPGEPDERPNNWESLFGGSAWSYDDERDAWYLHLFDERMPDLNWRNPAVREEIYDVMAWWLDRDIDGFRLDVVNLLSKPEGLPDGDPASGIVGSNYFMNDPTVHDYIREMHDRVVGGPDTITIGETLDITPADARRYVVEDGLDLVFPFEHMHIDAGGAGPWDIAEWNLEDLKAVTERWQTGVGEGWLGLYLGNHDQPRAVSRFGDDDTYRVESATMLATFLLTLRGTPFIYQGEELGMANPTFESLEEYRDPATLDRVELALQTGSIEAFEEIERAVNYWSRDNARTPMQWADAPNAGFTTDEPWIKVNRNYPQVNAARERARDDSVWHYYRRLIDLRREQPGLVYGSYEPVLEAHPEVFAYQRVSDEVRLLVLLNFFDGTPNVDLSAGVADRDWALQLANYEVRADAPLDGAELEPYEARIYRNRR